MTSEAHAANAASLEVERLEVRLDAAATRLARIEQANDGAVPGTVVRRLAKVAVSRQHRSPPPDALATIAGVPVALLAQIKPGREDAASAQGRNRASPAHRSQ